MIYTQIKLGWIFRHFRFGLKLLMLELAPGRNGDEESDPTLPMKVATLEERTDVLKNLTKAQLR